MAKIGTTWGYGSWADDVWGAGTWGTAWTDITLDVTDTQAVFVNQAVDFENNTNVDLSGNDNNADFEYNTDVDFPNDHEVRIT